MRYKERIPRPTVCENCPEWSIEACWDCEHIRQRYEIDDGDWEHEQQVRQKLRKLLEVDREEQYHILRWKPYHVPPVEDTHVLVLQCDTEFGHWCLPGLYRGGVFWCCDGGAPIDELEESTIIGWDYFPYEEHNDPGFENLVYEHLTSFGKDVWEGKAQWPSAISIEKQPEV